MSDDSAVANDPVRMRFRSRWAKVSASPHPPAAIYVIASDAGTSAKLGALEKADNFERRLGDVRRKQREREGSPSEGDEVQLGVLVELDGLVVTPESLPEALDNWAHVEHIESATRLVISRWLGHADGSWTDWMRLEPAVALAEWPVLMAAALQEVDSLGASGAPRSPRF